MTASFRVGLIGYGFIGRALYRELNLAGIEVAHVHSRTPEKIADLPPEVATSEAEAFLSRAAGLDLVVEVAHADVTRALGTEILSRTNYMPCSVSVLADDELREQLLGVARQAGTRLYVPHGAVVGMDNLLEARDQWRSVQITFRKPPASITPGMQLDTAEALLFAGSVREAASKFPRSVNAMVACALATIGLDATRARMIADSGCGEVLRGEFEFTGRDGSRLTIIKEEPAVGVSGVGMIGAIKGSVLRALGVTGAGVAFV
jgi:aspartate dehydrogenase